MLRLGFQDLKKKPLKESSDFVKARDDSPDSVIFTQNDPNFSLFSSASASVDRCSFTSDVHDHESLVSELSKHLAGCAVHDECSSGPHLDLTNRSTLEKNRNCTKDRNRAKEHKEKEQEETGSDDSKTLDSSRNSFSLALIECQNRRFRPEAVVSVVRRRRPASLDLNSSRINNAIVNATSPRFGGMKKVSVTSSRNSGTFPSPGTPSVVQKGWSSERVPLPGNGNNNNRRNMGLPFNSGRSTLPSKWEDAEKWIFSPVNRPSAPLPHRRPKSKSGPLGPPGMAYYSMYSPVMPMFEGGGNSPFSAGVLAAASSPGQANSNGGSSGSGGVGSYQTHAEPCIMRSVSVHGWSSDLPIQSLPEDQDENPDGSSWIEHAEENFNGSADAATIITRDVSRRDVATQMSPVWSTHSSPKGRHSFSSSPHSLLPIVEVKGSNSSRLEIRDVQVDDRVTMTRWSKKHGSRGPEKSCVNVGDWKNITTKTQTSTWEVSDATKCISKLKREEAKITAWENLQKAKAEAAIRKLEMKLEKKRSSSMDKILNKLRLAQKKAQKMRNSASSTTQSHEISRTSNRTVSFRRPTQMGSLSGCFTCHAF
ncbi:hypothetical protein GIB67_017603 [Kingdonia uniflora]|uniref:Remorin C-terminal domain-containing protein n=1 Tax=Kingdonia uniflora TaxID=39325 RepID=A0A7J7LMU3_9MAGN|nr:hypothetical protein GIB67_017603 [Kingdonia uniflora]